MVSLKRVKKMTGFKDMGESSFSLDFCTASLRKKWLLLLNEKLYYWNFSLIFLYKTKTRKTIKQSVGKYKGKRKRK